MSTIIAVQPILDIIAGIIAVGGIFYFLGQYKKGKSDQQGADDNDALTTIKIKDATILALQDANKYLQGEKTKLSEDNQKLGERVAVVEADNKRMQLLIDNRNPELEQFIDAATKSLASILKTNETIMEAIHLILKSQPSAPATVTVNTNGKS